MQRAQQRLMLVIPLTLHHICDHLFEHTILTKVAIVFLAVPFSLVGTSGSSTFSDITSALPFGSHYRAGGSGC